MTHKEMSAKGGKAGKGKSKARTSDQARAAVNARWGKIPSDIENYLASEKCDGIRCFWTGSEFMTRHGNILYAPEWIKAGMPSVRLDGELWMGRGTFDTLQSRLQTNGGDWEGVRFSIFDLAVLRMTTLERLTELSKLDLPAHCELVSHIEVTRESLDAMEAEIVAGGGEGVCLRHKFENYRPSNFIKVKRLYPDIDRWHG
jgi:DNA ligase 1